MRCGIRQLELNFVVFLTHFSCIWGFAWIQTFLLTWTELQVQFNPMSTKPGMSPVDVRDGSPTAQHPPQPSNKEKWVQLSVTLCAFSIRINLEVFRNVFSAHCCMKIAPVYGWSITISKSPRPSTLFSGPSIQTAFFSIFITVLFFFFFFELLVASLLGWSPSTLRSETTAFPSVVCCLACTSTEVRPHPYLLCRHWGLFVWVMPVYEGKFTLHAS